MVERVAEDGRVAVDVLPGPHDIAEGPREILDEVGRLGRRIEEATKTLKDLRQSHSELAARKLKAEMTLEQVAGRREDAAGGALPVGRLLARQCPARRMSEAEADEEHNWTS